MKFKLLTLSLILSAFAFSALAQEPAKDPKAKTEAPKTETPKTAAPAKPEADKTAKPTPLRPKGAQIDFPEVEGWTKGEVIKYPQREMGYSVNYDAADGTRVSVYVYNNGRSDIKNSLAGPVTEEVEMAKAGIDAMAEMGHYTDVKVVKDEKTKLGGKTGKIEVLRKSLSFKTNGNELHSEIIIFPFEGNFIKFRATRPKSAGAAAEEAVNRLLAEIEAMFLMYMDISDASRTASN